MLTFNFKIKTTYNIVSCMTRLYKLNKGAVLLNILRMKNRYLGKLVLYAIDMYFA